MIKKTQLATQPIPVLVTNMPLEDWRGRERRKVHPMVVITFFFGGALVLYELSFGIDVTILVTGGLMMTGAALASMF
jgi:hypothetical protein